MKIRISPEAEEFFAWRNQMRQKHRVMTWAEYNSWCRSGDIISHPSTSNCFPGGLTIDFRGGRESGIMGRCVDETSN